MAQTVLSDVCGQTSARTGTHASSVLVGRDEHAGGVRTDSCQRANMREHAGGVRTP